MSRRITVNVTPEEFELLSRWAAERSLARAIVEPAIERARRWAQAALKQGRDAAESGPPTARLQNPTHSERPPNPAHSSTKSLRTDKAGVPAADDKELRRARAVLRELTQVGKPSRTR